MILGPSPDVTRVAVPALFAGLFDDAANFPPGNLPLQHAVSAHLWRRQTSQTAALGPLVVRAADLPDLAVIVQESADTAPGYHPANLHDLLDLAVTAPSPLAAGDAINSAAAVPFTRLTALEIAIPHDMAPNAVLPALQSTAEEAADIAIFVEIPRDHRRDPLLTALSGTRYMAKFRTGGVRAELYPDEAELAQAIIAAVSNTVPFKATAGLHHALRNTDHESGFEQHGFLNVLSATAAALAGASTDAVAQILTDRDADRMRARVRGLDTAVRQAFRSLGTCSIDEPLGDLAHLGLIGAGSESEHAS